MAKQAADAITRAGLADGVYISPISAWGDRLAEQAGTPEHRPLPARPKTWFARVLGAPTVRQAALTPDIAIDSARLPSPHRIDDVVEEVYPRRPDR